MSGAAGATSDAMPLYFRIFMILEREIRGGQYGPDTPLPSETEIAERFDVSRVTIRHTMRMLAERGLIWRQRGKGTFATQPRAGGSQASSFDGLNRNIEDFETHSSVTILETGTAALPHWAAQRLGTQEGGFKQIVRLRHDEIGPFSYSACYLFPPASEAIDPGQLGNRTILGVLEAAGIAAERVEQRLTAVAAAPEVALHLYIAIGTPVTLMRRIVFDSADKAFEVLEVYYRPDRFEYSVNLKRDAKSSDLSPRWIEHDG